MVWTLLAIGMAVASAQTRDLARYPASTSVGSATLAAEYLVHSIPVEAGAIHAEDYLVVDAAFFGDAPRQLSPSHFTLRINGKKAVVYPQTPEWVAASIRDPAWIGQRPQLTVGAGMGNAGVILGRPQPVERFPDDPTVRRAPIGTASAREQGVSLTDQLRAVSMPEGERKLPTGGLLFFAYKGKLKSIKTLELLYEGPGARGIVLLPH
jgi:hypothetical protein